MPRPKKQTAILPIEGTAYLLLPDQTIARRLKPYVKAGKIYYNLSLGVSGKTSRHTVADLPSYLAKLQQPAQPSPAADPAN